MTALPSWIDAELWEEYVAQRKKDKKAMSPRSERSRIAELYELHEKGHDANKSLEEALNGHWLAFYEPRERVVTNVVRQYNVTREEPMTEAQVVAAREAAEEFRRKHVRRVA